MQKFDREQINQLINKNDKAVERAIVRLFSFQTSDEQQSDSTKHHNGVGFSGPNAKLGTYYAKWVNSGKSLTGAHLEKARKIALTHSQQLVNYANRNIQ